MSVLRRPPAPSTTQGTDQAWENVCLECCHTGAVSPGRFHKDGGERAVACAGKMAPPRPQPPHRIPRQYAPPWVAQVPGSGSYTLVSWLKSQKEASFPIWGLVPRACLTALTDGISAFLRRASRDPAQCQAQNRPRAHSPSWVTGSLLTWPFHCWMSQSSMTRVPFWSTPHFSPPGRGLCTSEDTMVELPPGASPLRHLPVTRGPLPRDSVLKASVHQARRVHLAAGDSLLPWRVAAPLMALLPAALCPCSWHSPEAESLTPLTLSQHSQGPQGGSLLPLSRELAEPTRGGQQGLKCRLHRSSFEFPAGASNSVGARSQAFKVTLLRLESCLPLQALTTWALVYPLWASVFSAGKWDSTQRLRKQEEQPTYVHAQEMLVPLVGQYLGGGVSSCGAVSWGSPYLFFPFSASLSPLSLHPGAVHLGLHLENTRCPCLRA